MKKSLLLALGCAMLAGTAVAQNAQEVTYVEDPSQGYLLNKFSDNWFIQAEGGISVGFTRDDSHRKFWDRTAPAAGLYIGKWFSPIIGARLGGEFLSVKGLADVDRALLGAIPWEPIKHGHYYKTKVNYAGPAFDVMINLTNWWCGYRPGRVYNAYFYAGGGFYWTFAKFRESNGDVKWKTNSTV